MKKMMLFLLPVILFAASSAPRESPEKPTKNFNSGFDAQNAGNFEEAIQFYKKAIEEKSDDADAWNKIGRAHV